MNVVHLCPKCHKPHDEDNEICSSCYWEEYESPPENYVWGPELVRKNEPHYDD